MFTKAQTQIQNSKDKCKQIQAQMSMENREGLQVQQLQDESVRVPGGLGRDGFKQPNLNAHCNKGDRYTDMELGGLQVTQLQDESALARTGRQAGGQVGRTLNQTGRRTGGQTGVRTGGPTG